MYLKIFPFIFYTFNIKSNTKKINNMSIKVILMVFYFIPVKEVKKCLQAKDEHFAPQGTFIVI
jgi:hypothetical protein